MEEWCLMQIDIALHHAEEIMKNNLEYIGLFIYSSRLI